MWFLCLMFFIFFNFSHSDTICPQGQYISHDGGCIEPFSLFIRTKPNMYETNNQTDLNLNQTGIHKTTRRPNYPLFPPSEKTNLKHNGTNIRRTTRRSGFIAQSTQKNDLQSSDTNIRRTIEKPDFKILTKNTSSLTSEE